MPADLLAFGLAVALAAEPPAPKEEPPVALIEFLGLWITEDGKWIDPEALDALPDAAPPGAREAAPDAPKAPEAAPAPHPEAPKDHHADGEGEAKDGGETDHE
jgi:hypothetical protein